MGLKIGEYLLSIGALTEAQVGSVLRAQKAGDSRKFGEIAVSNGFTKDSSITRFTDFLSDHQDFNT
jgi:hypothetical protein